MNIADFGCGTGYFSLPLAKIVGQEGKVYALDILKSKLENIASQAKLAGLNNIVVKRTNLHLNNGSTLEKESIDWVILVNMLFQNNDDSRKKIIKESRRVLKNGGNILIIEWDATDTSIRPDQSLRIPREEMTSIARENGLRILKNVSVSNFHYGMILAK